jgi:hypothetical protein
MFYLFFVVSIFIIILEFMVAKKQAGIKNLILPVLFTLILIFIDVGKFGIYMLITVVLLWIIAVLFIFRKKISL